MLAVYIVSLLIGGLILTLFLFGLTQPRKLTLEESIVMNTSAEQISPYLIQYRLFVKWSPWSEKDPDMQQSIPETEGKIGSRYTWSGNRQVGRGSMTLKEIEATHVMHELVFGQRPASLAIFSLHEEQQQTRLSWTLQTDMGKNPLGRAFVPLMKKMIQRDFNHGLNKLKKLIEHAS